MTPFTNALQQMAGRRAQISADLGQAKVSLEATRREWALDETARIVGVHVTDRTRQRVQSIFGGIGTAALQAVFGDGSDFRIEFDQTESQRRRAFFCVETNGVRGDPMEKSGNSVAAVLSTILRRAVVILHPELRNLLIADEPLEGVDAQKQNGLVQIDREMCDSHSLQLVVVSHIASEMYQDIADVVVQVERDSPRTSQVQVTKRDNES